LSIDLIESYKLRKSFSKIPSVLAIPHLLGVQIKSYDDFLQRDVRPEERKDMGLHRAFKMVFPIEDYNGKASLEYVTYRFDKPKYEPGECRLKGYTYVAPLYVTFRLVIWETPESGGERTIRDVKEQEVYFGEIPIMTSNGAFIVNGTERAIVNQLHRSPGVFFDQMKSKEQSMGRVSYSARIVPQDGRWLDFEFDSKDLFQVRIDRKKKFLVTVLIKTLGYSAKEIMHYFYPTETIYLEHGELKKSVNPEVLSFQRASADITNPKTGEVIVKKGRRFVRNLIEKLHQAQVNKIPIQASDIVGRISADDLVDESTGEVIVNFNEEITEDKFKDLKTRGISEFKVFYIDNVAVVASLRNTLLADKIKTREEAITELYKKFRPTDPSTLSVAQTFFDNMFFNPDTYRLSKVGRLKINYKLNHGISDEVLTLTKEDIMGTVRYLLNLKGGRGTTDDIDHLGNRRVRTVGELIEDRLYHGLERLARSVKEKMGYQTVENLMPSELLIPKTVIAVVKEFFATGQLSQFMDQTNPLSEITHKRRLSALGPGGLTRERAGFEVRDVHSSHYGRICPIETPEGPNIGLISSLSTYAKINEYGFIQTPYRIVRNGKVTDEIVYYNALEEEKYIIAQANAPLDEHGRFTSEIISARHKGEFLMVEADKDKVELMDVSPSQLVSVSASLIPFLEHDDANRALMGSNMQRQAVPLVRTSAPLVGTGLERTVAKDSGVTVVATTDGIVEYVDAARIIVRATGNGNGDGGVDIYNLIKFQRSNQNTCWNQRPIVKKNQRIKEGQIIADGPSTDYGELALGQNVIVAFMPWGGYNFEDAILMSEQLVKEDRFTSIHIEEFEAIARETKLGREEITKDIPNVGEDVLRNLDESGIIRIGAEVKPGDILVGKISPKGETQLSPEERLLRAIFGDKAGDVKDTSLRTTPGVSGTVIDVKMLISRIVSKDERAKIIEDFEITRLKQDRDDEIKILREDATQRVKSFILGKTSSGRLTLNRKIMLKKGDKISEEVLQSLPFEKLADITLERGEVIESEIKKTIEKTLEQTDLIKMVYDNKINKLTRPDELPPGVLKVVKVYVAVKRKLQVGDKMAGRHGNKGVISKILPEEDMPYLSDGTPVQMVLNPLGVPSRMNVGQILETHLGWAAKELGRQLNEYIENEFSPASLRKKLEEIYDSKQLKKLIDSSSDEEVVELVKRLKDGIPIESPVFDGSNEKEIKQMLKKAGLPVEGKTILFDGRTGEPFDQKVAVGVMYMLKLHHLVEEKIHARAIGPYSLVTQQPLGGKAHFGGQRLGEMEVWALEAYGASYTLQEFLTVKSDDVIGRTRIFDSIVKGDMNFEPGLPESFKVLQKELQALALDIDLLEDGSGEENKELHRQKGGR
jgi:DNA-directed RNA polymerase subunit beta